MPIPYGVIVFYLALALWFGLLVQGYRRGAYTPFILFGLAFLLFLNGRYAFDQTANSIAFFIGIYDVPDNLGVGKLAAALAQCADNACTV